jgi:hypothetical protein
MVEVGTFPSVLPLGGGFWLSLRRPVRSVQGFDKLLGQLLALGHILGDAAGEKFDAPGFWAADTFLCSGSAVDMAPLQYLVDSLC